MTQPLAAARQTREFSLTDRDFRFLSRLVFEQTGIVLADHKRDMVYARLSRRIRALGLRGFGDYCQLLKRRDSSAEVRNLINAITTNLTGFYREKHHFDHLTDTLFKPLAEKAEGQAAVRIWSAGCSSGMEPYSIALCAHDMLRHQLTRGLDLKILATDIDTNMLATARKGAYRLGDCEPIPESFREHYMAPSAQHPSQMEIKESVRSLVHFKELNLLHEWPMRGQFDAIFCRNVVIYFNKPTQVSLFHRFADQLKSGGLLYIGHSENLFDVIDRFEPVGRTVYRKREGA